jgi:hypothetical protein
MRWLRGAVVLAALGVCVAQVANARVPAFVRQTGLVCNQCHVTWTPTPDLTFTGVKFRLNGYRTPWVAEKIEAGQEGALGGRRLLLGVTGYLSYHMRANLFQQSKGSSDPVLAEPSAGPVTSNPFSSLAWDYAGPIAENVGIWTEWYSTNLNPSAPGSAGSIGNQFGAVRNDEFDVRMGFNPGAGGNIVSVFIYNQGQTSPFFGAFGSGTPAGGQGQFITIGVAGWLKDRAAIQLVVGPGTDNLDYKRMNYGAVLAVMPMNTDGMWLMPTWSVMTGNDNTPTAGGITGAAALSKGGAGYTSASMGDYTRNLIDVRWGFLDHGHWSINSATGYSWNKETYNDGAGSTLTGIGTTWRLWYDRTYGINAGVNKRLKYEFSDASGVVHPIPSDLGYNVLLVYRMAMNFAWEFGFSNAQNLRLDQNWRNGWSWNLQWHFLY